MRAAIQFFLLATCVACGILLAVAIATWSADVVPPRAAKTSENDLSHPLAERQFETLVPLPGATLADGAESRPDERERRLLDEQASRPSPGEATAAEAHARWNGDAGEPSQADNRTAVWIDNSAEGQTSTETALSHTGDLHNDGEAVQQGIANQAAVQPASAEAERIRAESIPYPRIAQQPSANGATGNGIPSLDSLMQMIRAAQGSATPAPSATPSTVSTTADGASSTPATQLPPPPPRTPQSSIEPATGEGADEGKLMINIQDENIRTVLEAFSAQGDLNILASPSVQGTVSAVLSNVDLEEALDAILKSSGYIARREGDFIYVGTPQDFQKIDHQLDEIGTRMYRPNYVTAAELQSLLQPLLTPGVGKISVTSQSEVGIASNDSKAGGDTYAAAETVLVQDYRAVLEQFDQIVREVDQRPLQVAIEAMILSVRLNDDYRFGIDWDLLRNRNTIQFTVGRPDGTVITGGDGGGDANNDQNTTGGLTFAFLDSSLGTFLEALETVGDANVIATPRLLCLNKQRAEILIGAELGYVSTTVTETSTSQTVEFLEVGAQLRLRPFISSDGNIRMEVHPELSTGQVRIEGGFTLPDKDVTSVTTNIMIRDGSTLIIGGLVREDLQTNTSQVPLLGNLPGIGVLFRRKEEVIERREILLLVTPHIVYEPEVAEEGEQAACEFHRRQAVYADHMSPIGKRLMGRRYFQLAQQAWFAGDREAARRYIHWAVYFDPLSRAAIDLQAEIESGGPPSDHSLRGMPVEAIPVDGPFEALDGEQLAPWLLDALKYEASETVPLHPRDPGIPGPQRDIE